MSRPESGDFSIACQGFALFKSTTEFRQKVTFPLDNPFKIDLT